MSLGSRILKAHLDSARIATTYLFTGGPLSLKEETALDFARALNCSSKTFFEACVCSSCHKIGQRSHPDVHWIGADPKERSIKMEEVRNLKSAAALKPYEAPWKIFIVVDAERLTLEAQNALLKILEEPPARTVFCLLVANKFHLLETICSRAFEIRLPENLSAQRLDKDPGSEIAAQLGGRSWEEFLEPYGGQNRGEIQTVCDLLMGYLRSRLELIPASRGADRYAVVQALESVYDTKAALEDNANAKLSLTHLAMQLRKNVPLAESPGS